MWKFVSYSIELIDWDVAFFSIFLPPQQFIPFHYFVTIYPCVDHFNSPLSPLHLSLFILSLSPQNLSFWVQWTPPPPHRTPSFPSPPPRLPYLAPHLPPPLPSFCLSLSHPIASFFGPQIPRPVSERERKLLRLKSRNSPSRRENWERGERLSGNRCLPRRVREREVERVVD